MSSALVENKGSKLLKFCNLLLNLVMKFQQLTIQLSRSPLSVANPEGVIDALDSPPSVPSNSKEQCNFQWYANRWAVPSHQDIAFYKSFFSGTGSEINF